MFPENLEYISGEIFIPSLKRTYIPGGAEINVYDYIIRSYSMYDILFTVYSQEGSKVQDAAEIIGLKFVEAENGNEMP